MAQRMRHLKRSYELRRLADSRDPDYPSALKIYVTCVSPEVQTNSNQITSWLDRSYIEFGDDFMVFAFYADRKVIGFAQIAFLRQPRVLFFDYIVLHRDHRTNGEYFQFARMLQEWVDEERLEFNYAAAEVSFESSGPEPSEHSVQLVELFKYMGFGAVQCEYFQPSLGADNPQSDMRAHLLVASRERLHSLKRETVIHIVKAIYFNHYERWFSAFLEDITIYRRLLEKRLRNLERGLGNEADVVVNGVKMPHRANRTSRAPRAAPRVPIWSPLLVVLAAGSFCGAFFFAQARAQLTWQVIALLFAGTLIIFLAAFGLFHRDGRTLLRNVLDAVTQIFDRSK